MIPSEQLKAMSDSLYTYDVIQGAWEHEPLGFVQNTKHILAHLSKDLIVKDFQDCSVVQDQIAPDLVQYALRLLRWSYQATNVIELAKTQTKEPLALVRHRYLSLTPGHVAAIAAIGTLAVMSHDLDHPSTYESALRSSPDTCRVTASLLLQGAEFQSRQCGFNLPEAFETRLAQLRKRFGIPQPI